MRFVQVAMDMSSQFNWLKVLHRLLWLWRR